MAEPSVRNLSRRVVKITRWTLPSTAPKANWMSKPMAIPGTPTRRRRRRTTYATTTSRPLAGASSVSTRARYRNRPPIIVSTLLLRISTTWVGWTQARCSRGRFHSTPTYTNHHYSMQNEQDATANLLKDGFAVRLATLELVFVR